MEVAETTPAAACVIGGKTGSGNISSKAEIFRSTRNWFPFCVTFTATHAYSLADAAVLAAQAHHSLEPASP